MITYQPIPAASAHSLGLARFSHAIRSFKVSSASIRLYPMSEAGRAASLASLREARSASSNIVCSGAVTTIRRVRSRVAFSAVRRRVVVTPCSVASMVSIQGHKAMASAMGSPVVSKARGIDPVRAPSAHVHRQINALRSMTAISCNILATHDPFRGVGVWRQSRMIVITAPAVLALMPGHGHAHRAGVSPSTVGTIRKDQP